METAYYDNSSIIIQLYSLLKEWVTRNKDNVHLLQKQWSTVLLTITWHDISGGFRISVRRQRGTIGVDGCGAWWRWPVHFPRKKIIFLSPNDKFGCILPQSLTRRKHGSLGRRILRFNREITKLAKTVQKSSKNSWSDQRGGRTITLPLYMPLHDIVAFNAT